MSQPSLMSLSRGLASDDLPTFARLSVADRIQHLSTPRESAPAAAVDVVRRVSTDAVSRLHLLAETNAVSSPGSGAEIVADSIALSTPLPTAKLAGEAIAPPPPTTALAARIAEHGLAYAEAREASGQVSDREVAALKAAALEQCAAEYHRLRDLTEPPSRPAAVYWEMKIECAHKPTAISAPAPIIRPTFLLTGWHAS